MRRGCASIFCNLAYKEGSEKSLVSAGIVPSLLVTAMITSDQMQAKIICVKVRISIIAIVINVVIYIFIVTVIVMIIIIIVIYIGVMVDQCNYT